MNKYKFFLPMHHLNHYLCKLVATDMKWEENARPVADVLYKQLFPNMEIDRESCTGEAGLNNQYRDIDLFIKFPKHQSWVPVSEKFRTDNYGDMLIEIYDERHLGKRGWGLYGEADKIFYLVPTSRCRQGGLYIMDESKIRTACNTIIREHRKQIQDFIKDKSKSKEEILDIGVCIRRSMQENKQTVFFCIPWNVLESFGVNVHTYPLNSDMNNYLLSKK